MASLLANSDMTRQCPGRKSQRFQGRMARKALFVLIDGLGDVCGGSDGKTPLQLADTPTFDSLARKGLTGLMDPVEPGIACGSDTAHLSIFGYPPQIFYDGRGAFETMGTGLSMNAGDIAFKCNFATWDPSTNLVVSRRADRNFVVEGPILSEALNGLATVIEGFRYQVAVQYATEHRCGVRIRGPNLTARISGTDPLKDNLPLIHCHPNSTDNNADLTSIVVNTFSKIFHDVLKIHPINKRREEEGKQPANIVLFRGPGGLPDFTPFSTKHDLRPFMIAPTCIIAGIGMALGMDIFKVPGATGDHNSDFSAKLSKASELLMNSDYNFGFVHIKAVDEASHNSEPYEKVKLLEKIDHALGHHLECLQRNKQNDYVVVLTGDHTTPSYSYHDHTAHPVPFGICPLSDGNYTSDNVCFDELSVRSGSLGRFTGSSVMPLIKHFMK